MSHLDALWTGLTRAAEQLSSQQVSVVLQEGQVEVPEELHVFVLHAELLRRVPVDHLKHSGKLTQYIYSTSEGNVVPLTDGFKSFADFKSILKSTFVSGGLAQTLVWCS